MIDLLFVIMLNHETPINKRQIALTAGLVITTSKNGFTTYIKVYYDRSYRRRFEKKMPSL
jgi:hypothetical protein